MSAYAHSYEVAITFDEEIKLMQLQDKLLMFAEVMAETNVGRGFPSG